MSEIIQAIIQAIVLGIVRPEGQVGRRAAFAQGLGLICLLVCLLPQPGRFNLRLLGVMAPERTPLFPDVPTFKERGYDLVFQAWGGLMLPKGTPADRRRSGPGRRRAREPM